MRVKQIDTDNFELSDGTSGGLSRDPVFPGGSSPTGRHIFWTDR